MKLKKYEVNVKALDNIELTSIGINVFRRNEPVVKVRKDAEVSGFPVPYLSFIEEDDQQFTLKMPYKSKTWDGTISYSTDTVNWEEWDGSQISSSKNGKLYLRGTNNTIITSCSDDSFILSPYDEDTTSKIKIQCNGNIENLLDYQVVKNNEHPVMGEQCFQYLFSYCEALTKAPELPATKMTNWCYYSMFSGCTSLTEAPELPATDLAVGCYGFMFQTCRALTKAPKLPAMVLTEDCYRDMFSGCSALTQAPEIPATTLSENCYNEMFNRCSSLVKAPELPATTLASGCYSFMFNKCTSLAGTIHCPASTASDENRLDTNANIPDGTATVVYDL